MVLFSKSRLLNVLFYIMRKMFIYIYDFHRLVKLLGDYNNDVKKMNDALKRFKNAFGRQKSR